MSYQDRSCQSKQKFYSHKEAMVHIHHLKMKRKTKDKDNLHAYDCVFCGGYHIGHTPQWVKNNIERIQK